MPTGLCTDERFAGHAPPDHVEGRADGEHPERPARLVAIDRALDDSGLRARCVPVAARVATRAELERAHAPAYLDALEAKLAEGAGWLDPDTYFSTGSGPSSSASARFFEAALRWI